MFKGREMLWYGEVMKIMLQIGGNLEYFVEEIEFYDDKLWI